MDFTTLLQFTPLYQTRVWGGRRLETILGRALPDAQPYGESWDLVDREQEQSVVSSGPWAGVTLHELWTTHRRECFGEALLSSTVPRFPLLIKVLDCVDDLSIQVHPPAHIAPALGGEPKTEMWYVAHADEGASVYAGVRSGVTRASFERALADGTVDACIARLPARTGDSLFVPSGRVHALGRGLLIYEIQQNSDTTYRVFDWNRVGLDGRPRELHVDQSLRCIDFSDVEPALAHRDGVLAECDYFRVTRARTGHASRRGRGRLIMPITSTAWAGVTLAPGALALCPAVLDLPDPVGEWLEIEL
ncbi:MAG: type I phosphomannose isomerase catalytic subunit [Acidobacteriota bacterium]